MPVIIRHATSVRPRSDEPTLLTTKASVCSILNIEYNPCLTYWSPNRTSSRYIIILPPIIPPKASSWAVYKFFAARSQRDKFHIVPPHNSPSTHHVRPQHESGPSSHQAIMAALTQAEIHHLLTAYNNLDEPIPIWNRPAWVYGVTITFMVCPSH